MNPEKKIQERAIIDHFRKHYPEFPKGRIIASESPDFILKTSPKKSIGIELSGLPSSSYFLNDIDGYQNFISDINFIILKKEEKIRLYQKSLAWEYWLILHIDSLQTGRFNFNSLWKRIDSVQAYDRIFLFDLFDGRILMLDQKNSFFK